MFALLLKQEQRIQRRNSINSENKLYALIRRRLLTYGNQLGHSGSSTSFSNKSSKEETCGAPSFCCAHLVLAGWSRGPIETPCTGVFEREKYVEIREHHISQGDADGELFNVVVCFPGASCTVRHSVLLFASLLNTNGTTSCMLQNASPCLNILLLKKCQRASERPHSLRFLVGVLKALCKKETTAAVREGRHRESEKNKAPTDVPTRQDTKKKKKKKIVSAFYLLPHDTQKPHHSIFLSYFLWIEVER
eukprot:gene11067-7698_t